MGEAAQNSQGCQQPYQDKHQSHAAPWINTDDETKTGCQFTIFGHQGFEHVSINQSLYRSILDSQIFTRKFRQHTKKMVQIHVEEHIDHLSDPSYPAEIAALHMVSSLLGLID